jgi:uncharacterized protein YndB with AHSA1/START domain
MNQPPNRLKVIAEPGQHDITLIRDLNAPPERVFRAFTDPTLIPQWWGPHGYTTIVEAMDVRAGGLWRFVQRSPDGSAYPFYGIYHEISAPHRLVYTFEYEGTPGQVMLETVIFDEHDGKTRITDTCVYQSVADRDAMIQSGMEEGTADSWDRFEALLSK